MDVFKIKDLDDKTHYVNPAQISYFTIETVPTYFRANPSRTGGRPLPTQPSFVCLRMSGGSCIDTESLVEDIIEASKGEAR